MPDLREVYYAEQLQIYCAKSRSVLFMFHTLYRWIGGGACAALHCPDLRTQANENLFCNVANGNDRIQAEEYTALCKGVYLFGPQVPLFTLYSHFIGQSKSRGLTSRVERTTQNCLLNFISQCLIAIFDSKTRRGRHESQALGLDPCPFLLIPDSEKVCNCSQQAHGSSCSGYFTLHRIVDDI